MFGTGSEQQPAISVSFDGAGNATVEIVLEPVRIREIDRVPDDRLDTDPNFQGACIRTRTIMVPPDDVGATRRAYEEIVQYSIRAVFPNSDITIPPCLPRPGDATADASDLTGVLKEFVEQLPRPTPVLNPQDAIAGLDTYLQTNRPLVYGPVTMTGGPFTVTLDAVGAYTVDWGQQDNGVGEAFQRVTGPHVIPGRNYERGRSPDDGAVTHVYTTVPDGPLEVAVTDYWNIRYSVTVTPTGSSVVDGATMVAELAPVSVPVDIREYQAVVVDQ